MEAWAAKRAIASLITLTRLSSKRESFLPLFLSVRVYVCVNRCTQKNIGGGPVRRSKRETITAPQCGSNKQTINSVCTLPKNKRERERERQREELREQGKDSEHERPHDEVAHKKEVTKNNKHNWAATPTAVTLGSLQGGMNSRSTREASLNIEKDKRAKQSSAYWGRERERERTTTCRDVA